MTTDAPASLCRLTVRPAGRDDAAFVYCLAADTQSHYLVDGIDPWTPQDIVHAIDSGLIDILVCDDVPVGALAVDDACELKATIHFLFHPRNFRLMRIKRSDMYPALAAWVDQRLKQHGKLKAEPYKHQNGAKRLLQDFDFLFVGMQRNEAQFNGKLTHKYLYELTRKHWSKRRGLWQ